ncbi:MAG: cellulose biosynthesis cyclic di-GMP-binding regulatory protein BcsB [Candidatus Omnitrophota bacterium]
MEQNTKISFAKISVVFFAVALLASTAFGASEPASNTALPAVEREKILTAKVPLLPGQNYVATGIYNERYAWVTIPENIELVGPPKLVYGMSHSETLSQESTLTVWFNDEPKASLVLSGANAARKTYEAEIPLSALKAGINGVRFRAYAIGDIEHPCQELSNPANWVVIHKDSYLELKYRLKAVEELRIFPKPFVERGPMTAFPLAFVLPAEPLAEELQAAAVFVKYFAELEPFSYPGMRVFLGRPPADILGSHNVIAIGVLDHQPFREDLVRRFGTEDLAGLENDRGLVAAGETVPGSGKSLLLISAQQPAAVLAAARAMTDPVIVGKMSGDHAIVDSSKAVRRLEKFPKRENPSFKDLGYGATKLTGIFETSADLLYTVPPQWELLPGTSLELDVSYSPLLDPNASILSVLLNDTPLKSFKLTGTEGKARFQVRLPEAMLEQKHFYFLIRAALSLGSGRTEELWCLDPHHDKAWVILHDTSRFQTPHGIRSETDLSYYPSAFMDEKGLSSVKLVLPDAAGAEHFETALNLVYATYSLTTSREDAEIRILKVSEVEKAQWGQDDMILVGSLLDHAIIRELNPKLPLPLDTDKGEPLRSRLEILPQFVQDAAVLQWLRSPWAAGRSVLVLTAGTPALLKKASEVFLDRKVASEWSGNIVLVNGKGQSDSYAQGLKKKKGFRGIPLAAKVWAICVIVLILAVVLMLFRRHRSGGQDPFKEI